MARGKLVAGNWKMNGLKANLGELDGIAKAANAVADRNVAVAICPPFTLVDRVVSALAGSSVATGGQDCHPKASGAHTGCISADMLKDLGATCVIVGHSERRADQGESDALIRAKAEAVLAAGLTAIVCVGETEAERDSGRAMDVVGAQIDGSVPETADVARLVVAYEPVWAIGTGRTPTVADVADMHGFIRQRLGATGAGVRILYGGSVKPDNARELLSAADVDGALVGGASLTAAQFVPIIEAAVAG